MSLRTSWGHQYLLITFLVLSANVRKIRRFVDEQRKAGTATVGRTPLPPRKRDLTGNHTQPPPEIGTDPPMAA